VGHPANNGTQQPKSRARQQCEANAQQKYENTSNSLNQQFWDNGWNSMKEGFYGGLAAGCLFTAEAGCAEGAAVGAVLGGTGGLGASFVHSIWTLTPQLQMARNQLQSDMHACSIIQ
jgi:hypothetical protein